MSGAATIQKWRRLTSELVKTGPMGTEQPSPDPGFTSTGDSNTLANMPPERYAWRAPTWLPAPISGGPLVTHLMLDVVAQVREGLKSVADVNPTFMSTDDKAAALLQLGRVESQVAELRMRVLACSDDVAQEAGARDAGAWLAHATNTRRDEAATMAALAADLDRQLPRLAAGMREGSINPGQALVIATALRRLREISGAEKPSPDVLDAAEAKLVEFAASFGPRELARLGRQILSLVAPDLADAAEARRLAELERKATEQTRMTMRRQGDGTTRISCRVPDAAATRLASYLEAFASPRQHGAAVVPANAAPGAPCQDPVGRLPYPRRLGEALCDFLEAVDISRLPLHGGDATTVVVTLDFAALTSSLATADLLGSGAVPGGSDGEAGAQITAAEARRLACTAKILPMVLGGDSLPLDLGRSRRLFSPAQRKALLVRDQVCRGEGCDIPGTWAEAHHLAPWSQGGPTDLDNAVLLCSHHHHRIHDDAFDHERMPSGDIRFHRRR